MDFNQCISIILEKEGGYVRNPNDPGGETNFGISKRAYPTENIKALTIERATELYKRDYWDKLGIELLPEEIRLMYFDCAVNQGPGRAKELYAKAKSEPLPSTHANPEFIALEAFAKLRMNHYTSLPGWKHFGAGWAKRLLEVTIESMI